MKSFADNTRVNKKVICNENEKDIDARPNPYKTPFGDLIVIKDTAKKLIVYSTNDMEFKDHMNKMIDLSKIITDMHLITFSSNEK